MDNSITKEDKTKSKKPILRWILTVCFGVLMFVCIPSFASILYALVTFAVCPAKKVRAIWDKTIPKSKLRTMLVIVAAFIALLISPADETITEPVDGNIAVVESSVEQEIEFCSKEIEDDVEDVILETVESVDAEAEVPSMPELTPKPTLEPTPEPTTTLEAVVSTTYVLNTNTKKFHYESCRSVKQIKDKNKSYYTGSREECINMGYDPCGNCHP